MTEPRGPRAPRVPITADKTSRTVDELTEQPHVHTGYLPGMGFGTGGNRLVLPTRPQLPGDPDLLDVTMTSRPQATNVTGPRNTAWTGARPRRLGCWFPLALGMLAWAAIGWVAGWWG